MIEELSRRRGGGLDGYTRADGGIVWDTYVGEDVVVQFPPVGKETLVAQAAALFSRTLAAGARVPEVIEYDETAPAYLVIERIHGQPLSTVRAETTNQDELAAVASAGEVLGQIHAADGEGYGDIDGPVFRRGSHRSLRACAREVVDDALAYTANGPFAAVVEAAADGFQPTVIPEQPRSSVLHDDFSGDNVIIDPDGRAWGIDLEYVFSPTEALLKPCNARN